MGEILSILVQFLYILLFSWIKIFWLISVKVNISRTSVFSRTHLLKNMRRKSTKDIDQLYLSLIIIFPILDAHFFLFLIHIFFSYLIISHVILSSLVVFHFILSYLSSPLLSSPLLMLELWARRRWRQIRKRNEVRQG